MMRTSLCLILFLGVVNSPSVCGFTTPTNFQRCISTTKLYDSLFGELYNDNNDNNDKVKIGVPKNYKDDAIPFAEEESERDR